jgi:predicted transcriptional regulator
MTVQSGMRKITISLPDELVKYVDHQAEGLQTSRSQVIGMALSSAKKRQEEQLAIEGYRFYAAESSEFAAASAEATAEAWNDSWADIVAEGTEDDRSAR